MYPIFPLKFFTKNVHCNCNGKTKTTPHIRKTFNGNTFRLYKAFSVQRI